MPEYRFAEGCLVQDVRDRSRIGPVVGRLVVAGRARYRVRFGAAPEAVSEEFLAPFSADDDPLQLLRRGHFGTHVQLRRLISFLKLKYRPTDHLFAFRASKTDFYPYQFKPLLRYLASPSRRLLIADEVGLGKTIEAGYILQEEAAQRRLKRVLVVCPAALRTKWRDELWRRFGEDFSILDRRGFMAFLEKFRTNGDIATLRGIVSLQSIRAEDVLDRIEAIAPPLDLLIVDEIHHCRNTGTLSRRAAGVLCETAAGVVGLSATPVHLKNENLFRLLEAMDPDEFDNLELFERRVRANRHVVGAERLLREASPQPNKVLEELRGIEKTDFGTTTMANPAYQDLVRRLSSATWLDHDDVVHLQRRLSDVNLLSHVISRTRKRDVHIQRPVRKAVTETAEFTADERKLYDEVSDFCRRVFAESSGMVGFAAITLQRQLASCLPAVLERYTCGPTPSVIGEDDSALAGDPLVDEDCEEVRLTDRPEFREIALWGREALQGVDSKFARLLHALRSLDKSDASRKVMLFSYFRGTLAYLERGLKAAGYPCCVIHGGIPSRPDDPEKDERGKVVERFRNDPACRILLSSEVGSEGLDFQFCSVVVNYDLPWNPMVVEQRIGRLDRIGQKSPKIHILNMTTAGTIEDLILERLYERVHIFEESIGDLEAILGEQVAILTHSLMKPDLTPAEQANLVDETARIVAEHKRSVDELERQSGHLVSQDAYIDEQIDRVQRLRRYVTPDELERIVLDYLGRQLPESGIPAERARIGGVHELRLCDEVSRFVLRHAPQTDRSLQELQASAVRRGKDQFARITFEPEVATAEPGTVLVTRFHALVTAVVSNIEFDKTLLHPCAGVRVDTAGVPAGHYAFAVHLVRSGTGRGSREFVPVFVDPESGRTLGAEASDSLFATMVADGEACESLHGLSHDVLAQVGEALDGVWADRFASAAARMEADHAIWIARRLQAVTTSHEAHVRRRRKIIDGLRGNLRAGGIVRMHEKVIGQLEAEYSAERVRLDGEIQLDVRDQCVVAGVVEVRGEA